MNVLGDLLDPADERTVVERPEFSAGETSMAQFTRTAWKTGNYFRHLGVRAGSTVAVSDDLAPEALYALFGAALLGATVRFVEPDDSWRVAVVPTAAVDRWSVPPGSTLVAYGGRPTDPSVAHFGTEIWSENPAFPEDGTVDRNDPLLVAEDVAYTHGDVLDTAEQIAKKTPLTDADSVAIRSPLAHPGTIVAGVVAPVLAGATIVVPDGDAVGTTAVAVGAAVPEPRRIAPDDVC